MVRPTTNQPETHYTEIVLRPTGGTVEHVATHDGVRLPDHERHIETVIHDVCARSASTSGRVAVFSERPDIRGGIQRDARALSKWLVGVFVVAVVGALVTRWLG